MTKTYLYENECHKCPVNSEIQNQIGPNQNACTCTKDHYREISSDGDMSCIACPSASVSIKGSIRQEDCACNVNYYAEITGTTMNCVKCPETKSNGGKVGSTTLNDCQCKSKDYFAVANTTSGEVVCEKCPKGAICSGLGVKIEDVISQP